MSSQHTVLLLQFKKDEPMTRTYLDFNTIDDAMLGLLKIYEQHLRRTALPGSNAHLQYDMSDLVEYMDSIADMSCMVFNDTQKVYLPHGLDWLKSRVYTQLKKSAKKIEAPCEPEPEETEE